MVSDAHERDRALIAWAQKADRHQLAYAYTLCKHNWQHVLISRALLRAHKVKPRSPRGLP